jgi:NAD(P)-dependent dehydrogenase (short-subunit alcohol dehydrogenase family)
MRYVITGGSGYIGTRLVELLSAREETERIVIADARTPSTYYRPKTEYARLDVRDRDGARALLEREQPDALVHLAFILNPSHDEHLMYDVGRREGRPRSPEDRARLATDPDAARQIARRAREGRRSRPVAGPTSIANGSPMSRSASYPSRRTTASPEAQASAERSYALEPALGGHRPR